MALCKEGTQKEVKITLLNVLINLADKSSVFTEGSCYLGHCLTVHKYNYAQSLATVSLKKTEHIKLISGETESFP